MRKSLLALAVALIVSSSFSGCMVYDPENYDKIHDQEFEDHLRQGSGDGGADL